jgi:hypothetical protein
LIYTPMFPLKFSLPLVKELCFYTFTLIISLHFFLLIDVVFSCICLKVVFLDMFLYWDFWIVGREIPFEIMWRWVLWLRIFGFSLVLMGLILCWDCLKCWFEDSLWKFILLGGELEIDWRCMLISARF